MSDVSYLLNQAWMERGKGDYRSSKETLSQAKALMEDDDYLFLGRLYHIYMQIESDQSQYEKALVFNQQSIEYYDKSGSADRLAHAIRHRADLLRHLGKDESAEREYVKALAIYREMNKPASSDLANALRGFAITLEHNGRLYEAVEAWKEVRHLYSLAAIVEGVNEAENRIDKLTSR